MYSNLMKARRGYGRAVTVTFAAVIALTLFFSGGMPFLSYRVSSQSMEPEYKVGSFVLVIRCPVSAVKAGDVIAFRSAAVGGQTVLHRAVRITEDGIITKGDNVAADDGGAVTAKNLVGKEVFHLNIAAGYFNACLSTRGKLMYIILPASVILLSAAAVYMFKRSRKR